MEINKIYNGDSLKVLKTFPNECIDCVITSPPYWGLRDYGVDGQLGLEPHFTEYIKKIIDIFDEVKRVLKKEGTVFVNLGDCYSNSGKGGDSKRLYSKRHTELGKISDVRRHGKPTRVKCLPSKSLCNIPARFSIEMQNSEWILRNKIIWHKNNVMPTSAKDRFTIDFEDVFFFSKNPVYFFNQQLEPLAPSTDVAYRKALRREKNYNSKGPYLQNTPYAKQVKKERGVSGSYIPPTGKDHNLMNNPLGKNKRCVWNINTKPFREAHFAVFPEALVRPMILAGCPTGGIVCDPFMGSGTTAFVARKLRRNYVGIELNKSYIKIAERRLAQQVML